LKKIINTESAPAAVGPYSQAVRAGDFVFISGQIGINPEDKEMAEGLEAQVEQVLNNLKAVVEAAGGTLESIVKTTVMLQSMDDFKVMNGIYQRFFESDPPARAAYEVAALPLGALVEIQAIAFLG
jgi:2-iminobutanoate/2-iminopropanoate deaminase